MCSCSLNLKAFEITLAVDLWVAFQKLFQFTFFPFCILPPRWLSSKESACNAGNMGTIPGWGRSPGGGLGNPLQYSCLEIPLGQRSLAGYSPWSCQELDTTDVAEHACIGQLDDVIRIILIKAQLTTGHIETSRNLL